MPLCLKLPYQHTMISKPQSGKEPANGMQQGLLAAHLCHLQQLAQLNLPRMTTDHEMTHPLCMLLLTA